MAGVTLPSVVSSTALSKEPKDVEKRLLLTAQGKEMDLEVAIAPEENTPSYSTQEIEKPMDEKLKSAEKVVKETISSKKAATLAKARAAKKEKAKVAKVTGNDVGDIMNTVIPLIEKKFEAFNKTLEDFTTMIARDYPLQQNGVTSRPAPFIDSLSHPQTYVGMTAATTQKEKQLDELIDSYSGIKRKLPTLDISNDRQAIMDHDNRLFKRRTQGMNRISGFENVGTEQRAMINKNQGLRAGVPIQQEKYIMF